LKHVLDLTWASSVLAHLCSYQDLKDRPALKICTLEINTDNRLSHSSAKLEGDNIIMSTGVDAKCIMAIANYFTFFVSRKGD
jgi:hypothetical protein